MGTIEPLRRWGAKAALADALSEVDESDGVLILIEKKEQKTHTFRSANLTNAEALYLMEDKKFNMFFEWNDALTTL